MASHYLHVDTAIRSVLEHFANEELFGFKLGTCDVCHMNDLIRLIVKSYHNIRMHHVAAVISQRLHLGSKRQRCTKSIQFKGN